MVVSSPNNQPPLANAGPDQSVKEGTLVTLDGSGSYDPDGDELTFLWTAPQGIVLSSNTAQKPTFTAPEVSKDTMLLFVLVVNDGVLNSQPDTVRITIKDISSGIIQTFYGSAQNDGGNRILSIGDGTYLSVGSYNSASFIMKTNAVGDTIWRKTFGSDQTFNDVIKTNDGNYIAVGRCGNCGNNRDEGIVYKFDPSGNILWTNKSFEGSDVVIFFKIANTSDNGYILTGTTTNTDAWLDVILLKLSSTGTTEWVKYFDRNLDDTAYDVKQTSDGGYIIAGHSGQWSIPVMWIIKTDSSGNKIWDKAHGGSGCHVNTCAQDQAKSIEIDTDGGYLIFGHRWIDADRKLDAVILKLDTDGNLVWEKNYGTNKDDYFFEHQKLNNGGFIIAGNIGQHQVGNSYDGKLFIVNNQFELVDSFSVGGAYNDALQSISALNDSTFAAIGRSNSNSLSVTDIWLLNISKDIASPTTNQSPIANAGSDQTINVGATVTLDGSASYDPDDDALTYKWTAPDGITLSSATATNPTFIAPEVTKDTAYTFKLVVNDGTVDSKPDSVNILIKNIYQIQTINLNAGWNIMSLYVMPKDPNLKNILQPLIDDGKLKKVMDETGKVIEDWGYFGGWQNTIGDLKNTEGYKINVTSPTTMEVTGVPTQLPFDIALNAGWNIISWPSPNEQDGMAVFQPLINAGKLKKVMDESGKVIEDWGYFGGWQNSISNLKPGEGYKVNVTEDCTLTINESGTKSEVIIPELIASTHFIPAYRGNGTDHMNINLLNLAESGIMEGDEIGIFDGTICVGSAQITNLQSLIVNQQSLIVIRNSISIPVSSVDGIGGKNGYSEGNRITLKLFRNGLEYPLTIKPLNNSKTLFEKGGSLFAQVGMATGLDELQVSGLSEIKVYPNPFNDEVTVEINLFNDSEVYIEVLNQLGQQVKYIAAGEQLNRGVHRLIWDGTNAGKSRVAPGIYLIRMKINDTVYYRKVVYSK
jgi:hypothetical protein